MGTALSKLPYNRGAKSDGKSDAEAILSRLGASSGATSAS
jgi:hypothetical protein